MKWLCALGGAASAVLAGCADTGSGPVLAMPPQASVSAAALPVVNQPLTVGARPTAVRTVAAGTPGRLSESEIKALLSGKSIKQVDDQFTAYFAPGGQIAASYYNADQSGTWRVSRGKLCQSFAEWNGGKSTCFDVLRGSGGVYRFHDTSNADGYTFRIR